MKKHLLKVFNNKKLTLVLLAFIGFSSLQLNAQNSDFEGTVNALWTNTDNWSGGVIAVDRATIKANVDLETGPRTVKEMRFIGSGFTVSNGTFIVGDVGSNNTINIGGLGDVGTFDTNCNFVVNVDGKRFRNNGTLIFNGTLTIGANDHTFLNLAGGDHYELNGTVTGTNLIKIQGTVNLGASSDLTGYTGNYEISNSNSLVSSTTMVFVDAAKSLSIDGTGSLTVNGANTVEGDIIRLAATAGAAEVTFNANQNNMNNLSVDTQTLALNFNAAVTEVTFSAMGTNTGVIDLKNYTSGVLKIGDGTTGTVTQTILDTWLLDGVEPADGAFTQHTDGTILFSACTTPAVVTTLPASAGAEYINLSWVDPTCFDEVLVVAKEGSEVTFSAPTGDGSSYTADAAFGTAGTNTNITADEFAVFKGSANTVTVNGLTKNGIVYHFAVFTRKGTNWSAGVTATATTNIRYTSISGANNADLNWGDTSSWIGGAIPSATSDDAFINVGLIITSDVELNDIVINGRLTINEGFSVKANDIEQNSQFIVSSSSSAFGSVIVNSFSGTSDLIYDRWLNDSPNNDLVSSPVSGVTFSSVATNSQNENRFFINPSDATNYLFGPFDNTDGTFKTYSTGTDDAIVIVSGKGYRAATKASEARDVRFAGALLTGAVNINITDGGHATFGQWNLIGNPFPSYVDFDTFFTTNTGQFETGANNAIYGWNGTSYTAWNALSGAKIAPGQGFFVKTTASTTGTVTFTPAMRVTGNSDDFIVGKSANSVKKSLAKVNLSSGTKTFATDIYFVENQTRGLDSGYDAGAFAGSRDGIYTNLVEANTGVDLLIQALPYNDFNNVVVPVAIKSEAGVELTISLDVASLTIPSNTYVYLKDNLLNTTTLLNDTDYIFTPSTKLSGAGRFFIEFSSKAALATEEYAVNEMLIYTNQTSKSIIIKGILKTAAIAKVFDIQGRMVLEQKLDSSSITNVMNANILNTGVYVIQLEGRTQKVIIK